MMSRLDTGKNSTYQHVPSRKAEVLNSNWKKQSMSKVQYHTVSKLISQEKTMPNMEYFVHCNKEINNVILTSCVS